MAEPVPSTSRTVLNGQISSNIVVPSDKMVPDVIVIDEAMDTLSPSGESDDVTPAQANSAAVTVRDNPFGGKRRRVGLPLYNAAKRPRRRAPAQRSAPQANNNISHNNINHNNNGNNNRFNSSASNLASQVDMVLHRC